MLKSFFDFIIKTILFTVGSWILIHITAVFGVFVSFAYPIWQFILPKKLPCLICLTKQEGQICPLCKRPVRRPDMMFPNNMRGILANSLIILIFSLFSIFVVIVESKTLNYLGIPPTQKTVAFIIPTKNQYPLGKIFPMKIELAGIKTPVNAIQADIGFDPEIIEVVNVSTVGSFANIFIQKEIDNENGYVRLTGGLPNPGFFSDHGDFGTVYFKGVSPGVSEVKFLPTSMVLANDGRGTNVIKELASTSYLILPDEIPEDEKKQQEVLLGAAVLGEKTDSTKMVFYDDPDTLSSTDEETSEIKKNVWQEIGYAFLCFLEFIDRIILNIWRDMLKIFS